MKRFLIMITVLALLVPGVLLAQDELTLEGLAAKVEGLASNVTEIFTTQDDLAQRLTAIETAIAPTPTAQTQAQEDIAILASILAKNDYEGRESATGSRETFYRLPEDEQERQIAIYHPLFVSATQRCNIEHGEMFQIVNLSADQLEYFGVAVKLETPVRAYWLEWFLTDEITEPCEFAIVDATVRLLDEHSITARPASTPEPTTEEVRSLSRLLLLNDYTAYGLDFLGLSQTERDRLVSIYYGYFVYTAKVCDLEYGDMFGLIQRHANSLDRRGSIAQLGTWRDRVPGGGFRLAFIGRISSISLLREFVGSNNCEDYLANYAK